jgi:hypothetical protein
LTFEIPPSKLDAHIVVFAQNLQLSLISIDPRLRTFPARMVCR